MKISPVNYLIHTPAYFNGVRLEDLIGFHWMTQTWTEYLFINFAKKVSPLHVPRFADKHKQIGDCPPATALTPIKLQAGWENSQSHLRASPNGKKKDFQCDRCVPPTPKIKRERRAPCVSLKRWRKSACGREEMHPKIERACHPLSLNGCDACGVEQIIISPGQHQRTAAVLTLAPRCEEVKPKSRVSQYSTQVHSLSKSLLWPKTAHALCCGLGGLMGEWFWNGGPVSLWTNRTLFCTSFQS